MSNWLGALGQSGHYAGQWIGGWCRQGRTSRRWRGHRGWRCCRWWVKVEKLSPSTSPTCVQKPAVLASCGEQTCSHVPDLCGGRTEWLSLPVASEPKPNCQPFGRIWQVMHPGPCGWWASWRSTRPSLSTRPSPSMEASDSVQLGNNNTFLFLSIINQ